jgi:hypothetical protein
MPQAPPPAPESLDYKQLAFFPSRWRDPPPSETQMHIFEGTHVVFLALASRGPYDPPS